MNRDSRNADGPEDLNPKFQATQWSMILSIARGDTVHAGAAREEFCRTYWHAVYGFIRARGKSRTEAEDLTQDFFLSHLLIKNAFKDLDPQKGRFRAFLMTAIRNFLANQYDRQTAQKRAPAKPLISLDDAENKYLSDTKVGWSPEMVFDRQWALAIVERALLRLRQYYAAKNKLELFEACKPFLTSEPLDGEYDHLAARFGIKNKAVAMFISRLRQRSRKWVREEMRATLNDPKDFEDEWRHFLAVMSQ